MLKLLDVELFFLVFILFIECGLSLKCYQCRSDEDKGCSSTSINITYSKECTNATHCRKIHQKLKFKNEKSWTSIRECAVQKQPGGCYHFKWVELGYQEICECDTENCNRGRSRNSDIFTIAVVFSLIWIFNYLKANIT